MGSFAARNSSHFGGPQLGNHEEECWRDFTCAGTAEQALEQLDENYTRWITGVRVLGVRGLARPCGPAEDPFGDEPMAMLVLHNREVIHHGAEIALLRDLYRTPHGVISDLDVVALDADPRRPPAEA